MKKPSNKRLLKIIEGLCLVWENGDISSVKRANNIIADIYRFSHLAGACENPHNDWRQQAIELEKSLKEHRIIS